MNTPIGASGSSIINTSDFVPVGVPDHCSGGLTSTSSHVYFFGILSPYLKAGLTSEKGITIIGGKPSIKGLLPVYCTEAVQHHFNRTCEIMNINT